MTYNVNIDGKQIKIKEGQIYFINGKQYAICSDCKQFIRVDKKLFGSLHVCIR